jgi:hypothetical protein
MTLPRIWFLYDRKNTMNKTTEPSAKKRSAKSNPLLPATSATAPPVAGVAPETIAGDDLLVFDPHLEIVIDPEFQALVFPLSASERAGLEADLLAVRRCLAPLLVWRWQEKKYLVDGNNRLELCREHGIPFRLEELEFPDRAAVMAYIENHQLGRRNLTPEGISYVRGKRYLTQRMSHGGDRSLRASTQNGYLKSAKEVALAFHVSVNTIRRDAVFAAAVDKVIANCGLVARDLLLSRDCGVRRGTVLWLAKQPVAEQAKFVQALKDGQRPSRPGTKEAKSAPLPLEVRTLAQQLLDRLGKDRVQAALSRLLKRSKPQGPARPEPATGS